MKIGILTLRYKNNFGGILQAIALQNVLQSNGNDVEIINYQSTKKESLLHNFLFRVTNLLVSKNIITVLKDKMKENHKYTGHDSEEFIIRNQKFMDKYLHRSNPVNELSISDYCQKFDCIIVGSDQVWSVTNSSCLAYFFDWSFDGKKVAYAACSVNSSPAVLNRNKVRYLLRQFDTISVRDETTANFVHRLTKCKPFIASDPTLLYDFSSFILPTKPKRDYILMYILGDEISGGNIQALDKIKSYCGETFDVISIVIPSVSLAGKKGADIVIDDCTPDQWINLIYHAKFVYTDSFHGCIFSLKFNKPFIGYYQYAKRSTRLLDIQKRYGLSNIVNDISLIDNALKYASNKNDVAIQTHIQKSMNYINCVLYENS